MFRDRLLAPGASFERRLMFTVWDRFFLRELGWKEECYYRSETVLAPGDSFERRLILTVWDHFGSVRLLHRLGRTLVLCRWITCVCLGPGLTLGVPFRPPLG